MCGYMPGRPAKRKRDDLEESVPASMSELLAVIRAAPVAFHEDILSGAANIALTYAKDASRLLAKRR